MSEQNQGTKLERIKIIWWYLVYRNLQTHEMGSHHWRSYSSANLGHGPPCRKDLQAIRG